MPTISGQGEIAVSLHHPPAGPWQDRRRRSAPEGATWSPYPAMRPAGRDQSMRTAFSLTSARGCGGGLASPSLESGSGTLKTGEGARTFMCSCISPNVARRAAARVAAIYPANVIDVRKGSDQRRRHPRRVLEHIQAFPIPGGIPKSREQCESSVAWGDGGRPWRELTARICVIV